MKVLIIYLLRLLLIALAIYLAYYLLIKRPAKKYKEQIERLEARRRGRIVDADFEVKRKDSTESKERDDE
ncbi:MAG: hypothetical protein Kow0090_17910 [Myxococcota bacterium]